MASPNGEDTLGPEAFLRALPPFDELDDDAFSETLGALEVTYFTAGTRVLHRGGEVSPHLYIIRKGTALLSRDGASVLSVEPGEWFGLTSVIEERPPEFDVDAVDDLLIYRLPGGLVRRLARSASFSEHITRGLASRLRAAWDGANDRSAALRMAAVATLITRTLVTVPPTADVEEIANTMRMERVSSVVLRSDPPAIVTTNDLRDRVLAEGRGPSTPGMSVASAPIIAVDAAAPIVEARAAMLERSMHHLGVRRDGELIAVVTTGDLLRHDASSPMHVQREFAALPRSSFGKVPERLRATADALLGGGLAPVEITRTISLLTDVLTQRAMALAIEQLGPAPTSFAWLALGSHGRREQTLVTDQDHALVHEEVDDRGAAWFHDFATDVSDQLAASGLPHCPGGVMATNWSGSVDDWRKRFERWFAQPDVDALYETSIFLDHRVVAGDLAVSGLDEVVRAHRRDGVLLARMAAGAGIQRPPVGLLHRIQTDSNGAVSLKDGGINPIVALARVLAIKVGSAARSTIERLEAGAGGGEISRDGAEELIEAFSYFQHLRLEEQLRAWRQGGDPSNRIRPDGMEPSRRRHLKEAFVAVTRIQQSTIHRFGGDEVSR